MLVDIDSVDVVALRGLPALLSALTGRVDVVAVTARAADRGSAAGRLLADEVRPGWRPLAGLTADAVVAGRWREHGLTVLGPKRPTPPGILQHHHRQRLTSPLGRATFGAG